MILNMDETPIEYVSGFLDMKWALLPQDGQDEKSFSNLSHIVDYSELNYTKKFTKVGSIPITKFIFSSSGPIHPVLFIVLLTIKHTVAK